MNDLLTKFARFQYCEQNFEQVDVESKLYLLQSIVASSVNAHAIGRQWPCKDTLFATITDLTVSSFEGVQGS